MQSISMQADYVLILEWLDPGDQRTGAELRGILEGQSVPVNFVECSGPGDLTGALVQALESIGTRGVPIVHIESHGQKPEEVTLKERAFGANGDSILWT